MNVEPREAMPAPADQNVRPELSTTPGNVPSAGPTSGSADRLGRPLVIEQVAELLGCSAWTIRQRYLPQGLPYLQARPRGKLVFFREQVIAWIEKRQRHMKGGILR